MNSEPRSNLSTILAATTIGLLLSSLLVYYALWQRRFSEARERDRQIIAVVDSLAKKRPSTMTRGQWGTAVGWTHNLIGNSLLAFQAPMDDLRRFQDDLDEKTQGDVDLSTLLWIWDQVACLTRAGKEYQRFRPHMLEDIEGAGPDHDVWGMNVP